MMLAMSFLCCIRSDTLLVCIVVILIFPAPEYPTAMTWKNCSSPFLSSISLIFFLTSIPLALRIGGWSWMIRHWGSAVGSWGIAQVGVGLGCFRLLVWLGLGGDAVTWAHDLGS